MPNEDVVDYPKGVSLPKDDWFASPQRISSVMVQSSIPIPAILVKSEGVESSKNAGLWIFAGVQTPLYAGLGILGTVHFP